MPEKNSIEFEELDFEEQCEIVSNSPLSEKADFIIRSQHPDKMIRSMSSEELFLVSKETESEMVPELFSHANLQQITFFGDMHVWKKDQVEPDKFLEFINDLIEADIERLAVWLTTIDHEVIVAGFKKLVTVCKAHDTEDIVEDRLGNRLYFTIDGYYYLSVEEGNFEAVKRGLEILYSTSPKIYITLIEGVISESLYETEEIAYSHRQDRLNEKGFPEPEEAYRIYSKITQNEWNKLETKHTHINESRKTPDIIPDDKDYLTVQKENRLFIDDVIVSMSKDDDRIKLGIQEELIGLSNKIVSVSGTGFINKKAIKDGIEQAHRFINIGLEDASKNNLFGAREILRNYWLEDIFRRGYSHIATLRDGALKISKIAGFDSTGSFCNFLGQPYEGTFSGLFRKIPRYCPKETVLADLEYRDFQCLEEIKKTSHIISGIEWLIIRLQENIPGRHNLLSSIIHSSNIEEITLSKLVLTSFVQFVTKNIFSIEPVSLNQFAIFLKKTDCFRKKDLSDNEKEFMKEFIAKISNSHDNLHGYAVLTDILRRSREEYFSISPKKKIEPQYLSFLLLKNPTFE